LETKTNKNKQKQTKTKQFAMKQSDWKQKLSLPVT
jgi:hypothetical protein